MSGCRERGIEGCAGQPSVQPSQQPFRSMQWREELPADRMLCVLRGQSKQQAATRMRPAGVGLGNWE